MIRLVPEEHLSLAPSTYPGAGFGLFAKKPIPKGHTIGYYTGRVLDDDEMELPKNYESLYIVWVCKDHWILAEGKLANHTRFINHEGKSPNTRLVVSTRWKTARVETLRKIKPGEEITFDYGQEYWDVLGIDPAPRPKK